MIIKQKEKSVFIIKVFGYQTLLEVIHEMECGIEGELYEIFVETSLKKFNNIFGSALSEKDIIKCTVKFWTGKSYLFTLVENDEIEVYKFTNRYDGE